MQMDISKVQPKDQAKIAKKYFIAGCFGMPLMWLVGVLWFIKPAFITKEPAPDPMLKRWLFACGIGLVISTIVFVCWNIIFQSLRESFGVTGESFTAVFPRGRF